MFDLKEISGTKGGKAILGLLAVVCAGTIFLVVRNYFGASDGAAASRARIFICSETGKPFPFELTEGVMVPVRSPHSGKETGYPAELCYWTADGKAKPEPTPVLPNLAVGKPGPTFCPDCGRLVVGHNPRSNEGGRVPPTQAEYGNRGSGDRER